MGLHLDIEQTLSAYRFSLAYARELVRDVDDNAMYRSFGDGLENTPGFTLGHLSIASAMMAEYLGDSYDVPTGWDDLFRRTGPGDSRRGVQSDRERPSKALLLAELTRLHDDVTSRVRAMSPSEFQKPVEWRLSKYYPTLGGLLSFMCVTHEAMHLAQVAAWRRAAGLDSALARM